MIWTHNLWAIRYGTICHDLYHNVDHMIWTLFWIKRNFISKTGVNVMLVTESLYCWLFFQSIKSIISISNLSPTHFVSNVRYQRQCDHFVAVLLVTLFDTSLLRLCRMECMFPSYLSVGTVRSHHVTISSPSCDCVA